MHWLSILSIRLTILYFAYLVFKRVTALCVSLLASRKWVQIRVDAVGLGVIRGFAADFSKGPVASISVREACFLRSSGATKAVRSAASAVSRLQLRAPLTVRGVRIVLRTPPEPREPGIAGRSQPDKPTVSPTSIFGRLFKASRSEKRRPPVVAAVRRPTGSSTAGHGCKARFSAWASRVASTAWRAFTKAAFCLVPALQRVPTRVAINTLLQSVLALVSIVPLRIKELELVHEAAGVRLDVQRVVVHLSMSKVFFRPRLHATITSIVTAVTDGTMPGPSSATAHQAVLETASASLEAALAVSWEKTGFCCRALTGGVDAVDITLSDALLAALSRRASHTLKPPPTRLPAEKPLAALGKLGKLLDEVTFRVPVIRLKSHNLGTTSVSAASHSIDSQPPLWVLGECKGLHLTAGSRRPAGQRRPATGALRRKMVAQPDEAQLLHVTVAYSGLTLRGGSGGPPAAGGAAAQASEADSAQTGVAAHDGILKRAAVSAVSTGSTLSLRLLQRQLGWRQSPALVSRIVLELGTVCTCMCPGTAWEAAAAMLLLQDALRSQRCGAPLDVQNVLPAAADATPTRLAAVEELPGLRAPADSTAVVAPGIRRASCQAEDVQIADSCGTEKPTPLQSPHKGGNQHSLPTDKLGGQLLLHIRVHLADSRLEVYPEGSRSALYIMSAAIGSSVLEGASPGLPAADGGESASATATPLQRAASLDGTEGLQQERRTLAKTPVSAADWLQRSPGGAPGGAAAAGHVAWQLTLGTLTVAVPSQVLPATADGLVGKVATGAESSTQQVLRIAHMTAEIGPAEKCRAHGRASTPAQFSGHLRVCGARLELDSGLAAALARVAVQLMPPRSLLAALKHSEGQAASSVSHSKRPPAMQLTSITAVVEDVALAYSLQVSVPAEHRREGTAETVECRLSVSLSGVGCEADLLERTANCTITALSISHVEVPAACSVPEPAAGHTPQNGDQQSTAQQPTAAQYARLAWSRRIGGELDPVHTSGRTAVRNGEFPEVTLLSVADISLSRHSRSASSNEQVNAGASEHHLSMEVSLTDPHACFDSDAAFTLLLFASEAAAIARAARCTSQSASSDSRPEQSSQHAFMALSAAASPVKPSLVRDRSPQEQPAVAVSVRLSRAQLQMPLNDDFTFVVKVSSAHYAVGQQKARVQGIALLLNGKPLVSIAALHGALALPSALRANGLPASAALSTATSLDTGTAARSPRVSAEAVPAAGSSDIFDAFVSTPIKMRRGASPIKSPSEGHAAMSQPDPVQSSSPFSTGSIGSVPENAPAAAPGVEPPGIGSSAPPTRRLRRPPSLVPLILDSWEPEPLRNVLPSRAAPDAGEDGELELPFHQAEDKLRAAQIRAGFDASEVDEGSARVPDPVLHPAAILSVAMEDLLISLPYGEEPGVAIRSTELWAKAFIQVVRSQTAHLFPTRDHLQSSARQLPTPQAAVELRISVRKGIAFRMEHHPFEVWLGVHGPQLRSAVLEQRLWTRTLPRISGANSKSALLHELANGYKAECHKIDAASWHEAPHLHSVMQAAAESLEAVLLISGTSPADHAAATAHIVAVDPQSRGVPMRQLRKIQLDVSMADLAVHFGGNSMPLAAADSCTASGTCAVGRQITAPPALYQRDIVVGRRRTATIYVAVKGSRSEIKVYTDLLLDMQRLSASYTAGLLPCIAVMVQAGKRLAPGDPDRSLPKGPKLEAWDLIRFLWRGQLRLKATEVDVALGITAEPDLIASTPRLQVQAHTLDLQLAAGSATLDATGLAATAYKLAHDLAAAGSLLALPVADVPVLHVDVEATWQLPGGRDPDEHHVFPLEVGAGPQQAVELVRLYESMGLDLHLDVDLGSTEAQLRASPDGQLRATESSSLYFGDHQIQFLHMMTSIFNRPPAVLKLPQRRGTFFAPLARRAGPPSLTIPKLFRRFVIALKAEPIAVVHYTSDLEDPSCGLTCSIARVQFGTTLLMNQPVLVARAQAMRNPQATRSVTLALHVMAEEVRVYHGHITSRQPSMRQSGKWPSQQLGAGQPTPGGSPRSTGRHPMNASDFFEEIATIAGASVTQAQDDGLPDAPCTIRPWAVKVRNCRLSVDLEARNALWATFEHIFAVLQLTKSPPEARRVNHVPNDDLFTIAGDGLLGVDVSERSGVSGRQQPRVSPSPCLSAEEDPESGGELLRLILAQRAAERCALEDQAGTEGAAPEDGSPDQWHGRALLMPGNDAALNDGRVVATPVVVRFQIDVEHLQISFQAESGGGRFLLAAEHSAVVGCERGSEVITSMSLCDVQAYVAPAETRPAAHTLWLDAVDDELLPAASGAQKLRQVFMPFSLQFRHAKSGAGGASGEDIGVKTPEISAALDSVEFAVVVDVITNVMLPPPPEVARITAEAMFHVVEGEDEDVEAARESFALQHSELAGLYAEALSVRSSLGLSWERTASERRTGSILAPRSSSFEALSSMRVSQVELVQPVDVGRDTEEVDDAAEAVAEYLAALQQGGGGGDVALSRRAGQQLLLQMLEEQIEGTRAASERSRDRLQDLKALVKKRQPLNHASRVDVRCSALKWQLLSAVVREAMVTTAIADLSLTMSRNQDLSGSSKFIIHRIDIFDPTPVASGTDAAASAVEDGSILEVWNPDESWERDPMVRVNAVMGVPTEEHTVYENLDLMVHPMRIHINDALLSNLWEYFFPKEEDGGKIGKGSKKTRSKGTWSRLPPLAMMAPGPDPAPAPEAETDGDVPLPTISTSPVLNAGAAAQWKQAPFEFSSSPTKFSRTGLRHLFGASEGMHAATAVQSAAAAVVCAFEKQAVLQPAPDLQRTSSAPGASFFGGASRTLSRAISKGSATIADAGAAAAAAIDEESAVVVPHARARRRAAPPRAALFVHVRFNRLHISITYKGRLLSVSGAKMVLDNRTYTHLAGKWRDLFDRLKWDIIKSVLKSLGGFQTKKVKELFPEHLRFSGQELRDKAGLQSTLKGWFSKKGASEDDKSAEDITALEVLQKKRLVFGDRHMTRVATARAAVAAAMGTGQDVDGSEEGSDSVPPAEADVPAANIRRTW